ncbi:MAG TPA: O-antigen ligase family protein [Coleofasciculaceae cyanobacterium]
MSELPRRFGFYQRLFGVSIVCLPYVSYIGFVGIGIVLIYLLKTLKRSLLDPVTGNGLLLVSGLIVLSCLFAWERGEAFLQLTNYLPFFLFFALMPALLKRTAQLEQLAFGIVMSSIPLNFLAFGEYLLRASFIPRPLQRLPLVKWIRDRPHEGRAMLTFGHPNALAAYLVVVFGLGLGLIFCYSLRRRAVEQGAVQPDRLQPGRLQLGRLHPAWLYAATFLNLLGIFSSGSRNGLVVSISQLLLCSLFTKASRAIWIGGLVSIGSVLAGITWLGIGGRSHLFGNATDESRLLIWRIALDLMRERPWLGWGLGSYKFLYPSRIVGLNVTETYVGHPHNLWLMLGCEAGLLVTIALTVWVGYVCFRGAKVLVLQQLPPGDRAILLGYLAAFWGCMSFALFDVPLFDARLNIMGWLLLSGIYAIASLTPVEPNLDLPNPSP